MASEWNLNDAWSPSDYDESDTDMERLRFQLDINEAPPLSNNEEILALRYKLKNRLSSDNKLQVLLFLLNIAKEGKLQYGSMKLASTQFNVATKTVSRIWNTVKHFTNAKV
ncbi:hypothetical protein BVRB_7g167940 [Beta vulgaris subsp. vulgaris]|nr:hypothetical protein BVRB_7g167940 [Beta vulgaris subsp. vulgaris]